MNLSEDEMEQAKMEWDSASIFQKKQWAESFKQKFEEKNNSKLKELTQSNSQAEEYQKAISAKYNAELDAFSNEVVGKELYGLKITDEMSKDLKTLSTKSLLSKTRTVHSTSPKCIPSGFGSNMEKIW